MTDEVRVFVREMTSRGYDLKRWRREQLDAPRVRGREVVVDDGSVGHTGAEPGRAKYRVSPGDDPFLTQTLQVHFMELDPGGSNRGHGHQNEAAFYILEGRGHEVHDDRRYDWEAGDLVVVHNDSVHRHFNDGDGPARALVVKAKALWMFLGLVHQGRKRSPDDDDAFGPAEDWTRLWSPGVEARKKVLKPGDRQWENTPEGRIKILASADKDDVRLFGVDIKLQEIPPGGHSAKHWHMADEVVYVLSGSGYSLHWDVEAEIDERFYARVAKEPSRHDVKSEDLLYMPVNCVHQHVNPSDDEPLVVLSAQNRVFKLLGYDSIVYLEAASEYTGDLPVTTASR